MKVKFTMAKEEVMADAAAYLCAALSGDEGDMADRINMDAIDFRVESYSREEKRRWARVQRRRGN